MIEAIKGNKGPVLDWINPDYKDFRIIAILDFWKFHQTAKLDWCDLEDILSASSY